MSSDVYVLLGLAIAIFAIVLSVVVSVLVVLNHRAIGSWIADLSSRLSSFRFKHKESVIEFVWLPPGSVLVDEDPPVGAGLAGDEKSLSEDSGQDL